MTVVGTPQKRVEDPRLIQGISHYVDDITPPDTLHVSILRSPYAHARIKSIDTNAAAKAPGVVLVFTAQDLPGGIGDVPVAAQLADMKVPRHRVLATHKVCYVGQPVVAVVASGRSQAKDAADLVQVDYEMLDAVSDPEKALEPGAPVIHEEIGNNLAFPWSIGFGDVDAAFKAADQVVSVRLVNQRVAPAAMEGRGVIAHWQPGEQMLTMWSSTQIPHLVRTQLSLLLGLPSHKVRVITPEVGGGFGSKLNFYAEEALLAHLTYKLGRPVKWIETRRENLSCTIQGRGQVGTMAAAVKKDGTILGIRYTAVQDVGAFYQLLTPVIPTLTGLMLTGPYKIPNAKMEIRGAFTNCVPTDAVRGAGRPEATFNIERLMDRVAVELKIDPVALRRKHFPKPEEFPFPTGTGLTYDSGNYEAPLDKALLLVDYNTWRAEQETRRKLKSDKQIGIGLSTYVEICAMGPSAALPAGGWEYACVRLDATGKVKVLTGASPHGQGQETSFAQLAADHLGVPMDDVVVLHGDTNVVAAGIGTFGSRATAVGGVAVFQALERVRDKAHRWAAHMLESKPEEVVFDAGRFTAKSGKAVTIQDVALAAHLVKTLPPGLEPGLEGTACYEPSNFTFPFGTHISIVEVDTETGDIEILKYVAVDDCGKVLNPLLVDGQVQGGIVHALGQALFEEVVYDESGNLLSGTFMDYAMPKAHQVPRFVTDRTETPSPVNPLGVKGIGEAGTIGGTPCIVNAVMDALAPWNVDNIPMPLRPERVWRAIQKGGKS